MPFRPDPSGFQGGQARPGVDLVKSGEEEDVEGVVGDDGAVGLGETGEVGGWCGGVGFERESVSGGIPGGL